MTGDSERRRPAPLLIATEIAALGMTLAAVAGFHRLFTDTLWVRPLVVSAIAAHVVMAVVRRSGRGLIVTGMAAVIGAVADVTWTHYRATSTALLPTNATRHAIDLDLESAWTLFAEVKAPTASTTGFLVLSTIALWVIAYLADWAAFRLWSPLEAMLPGFAMFVFIAFFGSSRSRLTLTALYLVAVVVFQLLHHLVRQAHDVRWLTGSRSAGTAALLGTGVIFTLLVVAGAVVIGPTLPGADRDAIVSLDGAGSGSSSRVVASPITDIRGRIVEQADVEAFTVDIGGVGNPTYWRLASLDSFNGQIWGTEQLSYDAANGRLDGDGFDTSTAVATIEQTFTIGRMGSVWVPAAFEPIRVTSRAFDIGYEEISGTLITTDDRDLDALEGEQYTVVSAIPAYDPNRLATAPPAIPQLIADRYLGLPDDFSTNASALAQQLTAGETTTYGKSLALQQYFRTFIYDLNVGPGNSTDRIDQFLAAGRGYCEQFASAFAAMARSIGIPARVAVGFTWGNYDPSDGLYHVRGEHAHAWPEVYIAESGWVAFEPTPGRGAPGAEGWTDVTAAQAGSDDGAAAPTPTPAVTTAASDPLPDPDLGLPLEEPTGAGATPTGSSGGSIPEPVRIGAVILLAAALLLAGYSAVVIGAKRSRARRRVERAADARSKVGAIWHNTTDALRPLDVRLEESETVREFAQRVRSSTGSASTHLDQIAGVVSSALYAPDPPDGAAVESAEQHHVALVASVNERLDRRARLRNLLDPRPLVRK